MPKGANRRGPSQGSHAAPQRSQSTLPATYRPQQAKSSQDISQYSRDSYGSAARASQSKKGGVWRVVFIVSIVVFVGALAALGAIGYQYWAQQNAYSGLEEYAEVDDNSNLALSDLKVDWDGLRAINPRHRSVGIRTWYAYQLSRGSGVR